MIEAKDRILSRYKDRDQIEADLMVKFRYIPQEEISEGYKSARGERLSSLEGYLDESTSCSGEDIFCQDGVCPDCNYKEYQEWVSDHACCNEDTWDCPDENDCPWEKGIFNFK